CAQAAERVVRRPEHADFQADGALALARRLGRNPRELAAEVAEHADLDDLCERVEIAGPGFVNLTLREPVIGGLLTGLHDERLGVPPPPAETGGGEYSPPQLPQ